MNNIFLRIIIIISALIGLSVSTYINIKKKKGLQLSCPLGADCDTVIHSEYSKFLGIPLEIMGIFYYVVISLSYFIFILFPQVVSSEILLIFLIFSLIGFLFSIYLTFIQLFAIREWCTWCLISAITSITIFIISLLITKISFFSVLEHYYNFILTLHLFGFVIGIIGSTFADILFFKFLKDFKLSIKEHNVIKFFSQIVWVGLAFLIVSGSGLYLLNIVALSSSPIFLAKMILISIIIVNSAFLNLYLVPILFTMSFIEENKSIKLVNARKNAFTMVAISFVSWYSALILGLLEKSISITLLHTLSIYIILIFLAIVISQSIGTLITKNKN